MAGESLKVVAGNASGSSIALDAELVIGRSTPGLGSLGGDSEISRVHARVYHDPSGQLMVEDLGSTNGTFVNGNRLSGAQALRSGDQVRVGQTTMTVEGGAADGATAIGAIIPPAAAATPPPPAAVAATPPTQPFQPAPPPQQPPQYAQQPPGPGYAGGPIGGPPQAVGGGNSKAPWYALAAVVLIALIVGGLAIGGVFGGGDDKKSTAAATVATTTPTVPTTPATPATPPPTAAMPEPPSTPSTPSSGGYPPGFVNKLVDSCASGGKLSRSQCQCWFGKLKDAYTFPQLVGVLRKAKTGTIPPKAVSLLRTCLQS
jgi:hypothetical protein